MKGGERWERGKRWRGAEEAQAGDETEKAGGA